MRRAAILMGAATLLFTGCANDVLVLEIIANDPLTEVDQLDISADANGTQGSAKTSSRAPLTLGTTPVTAAMVVPSNRRSGPLTIRVDALTKGAIVGFGVVTVDDVAAALRSNTPTQVVLRDSWRTECKRAGTIACVDFEDGKIAPFMQPIKVNADVTVQAGLNETLNALAVTPDTRMPLNLPAQATIAHMLDTHAAPRGLFLRFRFRVLPAMRAMRFFDLIELHHSATAPASSVTLNLGIYDPSNRLLGRRFDIPDTGYNSAGFGNGPVVDDQWHCVWWQVLGGPTSRESHLWYDGSIVEGFDFTTLPSLDFEVVQFGLLSGMRNMAPAEVDFDDILVTMHEPAHECP